MKPEVLRGGCQIHYLRPNRGCLERHFVIASTVGVLSERRIRGQPEALPMTDDSRIPFEELALNADEVGKLLGCGGRQVLERIACKPDFPRRLSIRPASWVAKEILEWRDAHRR